MGALREHAGQLGRRWPGYAALLDFYAAVREAQQAPMPAAERFRTICRLGKAANPLLRSQAEGLEAAIAARDLDLEELLADGSAARIEQAAAERGLDARVLSFLVDASLRAPTSTPVTQDATEARPEGATPTSCPDCGAPPMLSLLRGEHGMRHSLCSSCGHEWQVDRVSCSVCGNKAESREYFHAEGDSVCRIDVCDACRHYIKTIDLRTLSTPDPTLEDLASQHLDVLATQRGYRRVAPHPWF